AAAVADDLDVRAAGLDPGHAGRRLLVILRLAAGVLGERSLRAADVDVVAEGEGALAVRHDRDLHDVGMGCAHRAARQRRGHRTDYAHGGERLPAPDPDSHLVMPSSLWGFDRAILAQTVTRYKWQVPPGPIEETGPDTEQAVGGDDHDREEDDPDDRVEAPAEEGSSEPEPGDVRVRRDVRVHDDEHESADPGALDSQKTADHGHHEQVDRRREVDVARRDLTAPPRVEHAGHGG